jgi:hypothetical protein
MAESLHPARKPSNRALAEFFWRLAKVSTQASVRVLDGMTFGTASLVYEATKPPTPIETRLQRLDEAKEALVESLEAIEQLKIEAENTNTRRAQALADLELLLASKQTAEQKLVTIKRAIQQDVTAFQELAGMSDVWKERTIGFLSGIAASMAASGLVWLIAWVAGRFAS